MLGENFTTELEMWCEQNKIIDKCQTGFWACYETYKTDDPKEFSKVFGNENKRYVSITLDKIKFCLNKIDYYDGKPTIEIDFEILLKDKCIGWYREVYFMNGDFVDDFFVIE